MDACFFKHFSDSSLLVGFSFFNVTLRESPMGTAAIFDKKVSYLIVDNSVNYRTARTFVKTFKLIVSAFFRKSDCILNLIRNESHAFGCNNVNSGAAVAPFDGGNNSAVESSHGMIDSHNVGTVRNAVIAFFAFDCAEIKLIDKTELSVYGADRVSNPHSDIFAEHITTPFERPFGLRLNTEIL